MLTSQGKVTNRTNCENVLGGLHVCVPEPDIFWWQPIAAYATGACVSLRLASPFQVVKVFERILYAADEKEAKEAMEQVLEEYNQQPTET